MKIHLAQLVFLVVALPALAATTDLPSPTLWPDGADDTTRDVIYLYDSPLLVWEEIVDLGGGQFRYTYRFENVDSDRIWHFGVWTTFWVTDVVSSWTGHDWSSFTGGVEEMLPAYDARNLDPGIVFATNTWGQDWPDTDDPIVPGESVEGFAFTAEVHDDSPKWYFYETIENGYAGDTGILAAVGLTVGVVATETRTLSRIKALYR